MVAVGIVVLPQDRWEVGRRKWLLAEEWGFDHAWTYDHLAWRTLVDGPWFATVPLLAAAAAVTSRIGLGTFVASPNFRHPVPFAKDVLGLDDISGGRFLLGVGAGGEGLDSWVAGDPISRGERTRRFEEFVGLLDTLLTRPVTQHQGEFYRADGARMIPGTLARPRTPFVVAANGPRTMALAARFGNGWVTYGQTFLSSGELDIEAEQEQWWEGLAAMQERVDEAVAAHRPPGLPPLRRYLSLDGAPIFSMESAERVVDGVERAAALGFTDVIVHWPRVEGVYGGSSKVLDALVEHLPALQAIEVPAR